MTSRRGDFSLSRVHTLQPIANASINAFGMYETNPQQSNNNNTHMKPIASGKTNADGCTNLSLGGRADPASVVFTAEAGGHFAITRNSPCDFPSVWNFSSSMEAGRQLPNHRLPLDLRRTNVVTDRTIYRLGHTIFFRGITRTISQKGFENPGSGIPVDVKFISPEHSNIAACKLRTGEFGDFHGSFVIPENGRTGDYQIVATFVDGTTVVTNAEVAQFRKPEYNVEILPESRITVAGSTLKFKIKANYFFGAPVPNATVNYKIRSQPDWSIRSDLADTSQYSCVSCGDRNRSNYYSDSLDESRGSVQTDARGEAIVEIKTPPSTGFSNKGPFEIDYLEKKFSVSAEVTDLSHKTVEGFGTAIVVPARFALMTNTNHTMISANQKMTVSIRAIGYDRRPVAGLPVNISFEHRDYDWLAASYAEKGTVLVEQHAITDKDGYAQIIITANKMWAGGRCFIKARATDDEGHVAGDSAACWFTGDGPMNECGDTAQLQIELDKSRYMPGETLRAIILRPRRFAKATGLLTIEGFNLDHRNLPLGKDNWSLELPIKESYAIGTRLGVCAVNSQREVIEADPVEVSVTPKTQLLSLDIKPTKHKYQPGEMAEFQIAARTSTGQPAPGANLMLALVDEKIFALKADTSCGIAKALFGHPVNLSTHLRKSFDRASSNLTLDLVPLTFGDVLKTAISSAFSKVVSQLNRLNSCSGGSEARYSNSRSENLQVNTGQSISQVAKSDYAVQNSGVIRSDFRDTAFWSPSLQTDRKGLATLQVKLPDNLTAWRLTAEAITKDTAVGSTRTSIIATKPLVARLSMPRFFTEGDAGFVTGIVHNYTDHKQNIKLNLFASVHFKIGKASLQSIMIPPHEVGKVTWPLQAVAKGQGRIIFKAAGQTGNDALAEEIPVRPFSYTVFAAKNGTLKDDNRVTEIPLKMSSDGRSGHFKLGVASSAIGPVLGSFDELIDYPYGCTEQTMSRLIPSVVAMQLHRKLGVPIKEETKKLFDHVYKKAFIKLVEHQNEDGGWGWWANDKSSAYLTAYVMEGLHWLTQCGYTIDKSMIDSGLERLQEYSGSFGDIGNLETGTDNAYVTYALSLYGKQPNQMALRKTCATIHTLGPESLSYLVLAFNQFGDRPASKAAYKQLMALANKNWEFTQWDHTPALYERLGIHGIRDYTYRFTGVETTALALRAVLTVEPDNEKLLSSIRRWILLQHDENGWINTKTTAAVFIALLEDELAASRGKPTNFTVTTRSGGKTLSSFVFGRPNQYCAEQVSTLALTGNENALTISKFGSGKLYYSSLLTYERSVKPGQKIVSQCSPPDLVLEREFFKLKTVRNADGARHISEVPIEQSAVRAGDTILMRITVRTPERFPYISMEAPLPSGAEVVSDKRIGGNWYTHRDILDDKIVFFIRDMSAGEATFDTLLRMEMPGKFNISPAKFEGMYTKSVRGNSSSDRIEIYAP